MKTRVWFTNVVCQKETQNKLDKRFIQGARRLNENWQKLSSENLTQWIFMRVDKSWLSVTKVLAKNRISVKYQTGVFQHIARIPWQNSATKPLGQLQTGFFSSVEQTPPFLQGFTRQRLRSRQKWKVKTSDDEDAPYAISSMSGFHYHGTDHRTWRHLLRSLAWTLESNVINSKEYKVCWLSQKTTHCDKKFHYIRVDICRRTDFSPTGCRFLHFCTG